MLKRLFAMFLLAALLVQCTPAVHGPYRRAARMLDQADKRLSTYHDDAAWARAVTAERIARDKGYADILCKSLLIKGKVCDYANVSADSNRDDEALVYLLESVSLADAHGLMPERVTARYIISEVYVNKNRWKADAIDSLTYRQAGTWLDEGVRIAGEARDSALLRKSLTFKLRYYRQGGNYDAAIAFCNDVISGCSEDDFLTLQQMYDQLTVLYQVTGNDSLSLAAHSRYVRYAQKQMSQIEDAPKAAARRTSTVIALLASVLVLVIGVLVFILAGRRRSKSAAARAGVPERTPNLTVNLDSLTNRELEILQMTAEGKTSAEIANTLSLSQRTVSNHKQNIYVKFGVNSSREMLRLYEEIIKGRD